MDFQVTDSVRMKANLKGINTFGIKRSVINKYRDTIMKTRDYHVCENGDRVLRIWGIGSKNELSMAVFNADMFEKVETKVL